MNLKIVRSLYLATMMMALAPLVVSVAQAATGSVGDKGPAGPAGPVGAKGVKEQLVIKAIKDQLVPLDQWDLLAQKDPQERVDKR